MHSGIDNVVICASAGSGKTYQLAQRYISLLRQGVPPERICALTFTRKAAGEMFDKIVEALLRAQHEAPPPEAQTLTHILRKLLHAIPRLQIATLDSFASGMARAFAFELGLPAAITLMDTQSPEGREEQAKLLANLTDPRRITKKARNDLLKALTLATHGQASKKSIETTLQTFLDHYAPTLRATARHWGDLTRAFPQGHPRPIADPSHRRQLLQTAQTSLQAEAPQIADRLLPTLRACAQFTPDHPLPKFEETLPKQLLTLLDPSQTTLTYNRKTYPLSQQTLTPIRALLTHLAATDLQRHARQTHGIALALEPYLQLESNHIIRTGRMTFDDLTRLLTLADATFTSAHPTLLEKRIYIDFRMDTRLDHYMLDEFQDTSDRQWQLLQPLISEVVTPPPGEKRSFFYVGDVKQSIYGWRGGNYHLFGQIHDQYRPWLTQRQLNQSFRSSPPVIQTINHAFDLTRLTQTTRQNLPPATLQFWQNQWQPHTISPKSKPRNGIAELITHPPGAPASDTIGDILRHLQSHGPKQLSIAILTRSNDQGAHLAQALKSQGFPIALEGNRDILDSPLIHLAISFLRAISHPADTAAWGHLLISPLAATYAPACGTPTEPGTQALRTAFSHTHLRHLHRHGLQNLLNNHLLPFLCPQTFTPHDTRRWRDLLRLARHADQNGDTDLDTFLRAIQSHTIQDTPTAGTIRIMTIHKSKGLGFNIVILPFPEHGESLSNPAPPPLLTGPDWALLRPHPPTCKLLPPITQHDQPARADKAYETLATLYVALTRAENALYMILPPPPKTETTIRPATLLRETLAGQTQGTYPSGAEIHYRQGDPHWHQTIAPLPTATPAPPFDPATLNLPPGHPRPKRFEPSATPPHPQTIASLLDPAQIAIRDFGTAIHRLFSRIRWLTDTDLETQIATWKATAPEDPQIIRDAETQFRHAITQPPIRAALTPPPTPCTLWLETPFTTRLSPSQYIGGRFDRVHIHPHRAEIFDYKSSLVDTPAQARHAAQTYHPQMALYRLALARLLNLPPPAITAHLLFTRTGQRITLTFQD